MVNNMINTLLKTKTWNTKIVGEFLKELYNTKLWITCGIVLFLVMLIFLWQGNLSGGDLREKELLNATSAGVYGML